MISGYFVEISEMKSMMMFLQRPSRDFPTSTWPGWVPHSLYSASMPYFFFSLSVLISEFSYDI